MSLEREEFSLHLTNAASFQLFAVQMHYIEQFACHWTGRGNSLCSRFR